MRFPSPRHSAPSSSGDGMGSAVRLNNPVNSSLTKNGALSMVGVVLQGGVRFLTLLLLGRLAGPLLLGVVASAIAFAVALSLLWPTTNGAAASKFMSRARGKQDDLEVHAVAAHLARRTIQAGLFLAAVAVPAWMIIDKGQATEALSVSVLVIGMSGYAFTRGVHFGASQIGRGIRWDMLSTSLGFLGVVICLLLGVRNIAVLIPMAAGQLLYTVACWPWSAHGRPARDLRREMDAFVLLGSMGTIASAGMLQVSMLVTKVSDGTARAGQYAAALALTAPLAIVATSLSLALYPRMAEAYGRGDHGGLRDQTDRATRVLAMLMVGCFGMLALASRPIVQVIWGSSFAFTATLVPIIAVALMLNTLGVPSVNSLTSRAHRGMIMVSAISAVGLLVAAIAWAALAPRWGATGVTAGYLCGVATTSFLVMAVVWRRDQQDWASLAARVLVALVVIAGTISLQRRLGWASWWDVLVALAFGLGWGLLMLPEVRVFVGGLRRRRQ